MGHWNKTIREAVWVSTVALLLAGSAYALRPHVLPLVAPDEDVAVTSTSEGDIVYIKLADAIRHFEQGSAIFADARPLKAFEMGHIQGALHLDPEAFDNWSERVFSEIPADQMVVAYCDGAQCTLSLELAEKFAWLGYENVVVFKDGWGQWQSSNMPVSVQTDP